MSLHYIDNSVLQLLVCPQDKGFLYYVPEEVFYNPRLKIAYPIRDNIPLLIAEDAIIVNDVLCQSRYEQGIRTDQIS